MKLLNNPFLRGKHDAMPVREGGNMLRGAGWVRLG